MTPRTRERKHLSLTEKNCKSKMKDDNKRLRNSQLSRTLKERCSTLFGIIKNRQTIESNGCARRKSPQPKKYADIEEVLVGWLRHARKQHTPLNRVMLREKALDIALKLGNVDFSCSNGWLDRFKHRHGIVYRRSRMRNGLRAKVGVYGNTMHIDEEVLNENINSVQNGDISFDNTNHSTATHAASNSDIRAITDKIAKLNDNAKPKDGLQNGERTVRLSNNLDIMLSDDEETQIPNGNIRESPKQTQVQNSQDDDFLVDGANKKSKDLNDATSDNQMDVDSEMPVKKTSTDKLITKETPASNIEPSIESADDLVGNKNDKSKIPNVGNEHLIRLDYVRLFKSKIASMNRDDMEEFILLKIVEGIAEKSELSDMKSKLKTLQDSAEEWRKKALLLMKQCRDLQVVLKTVQEEHKKRKNEVVTPLRITRSVGLQVLMQGAGTRPKLPSPGSTSTKKGTNNTTTSPSTVATSLRGTRRSNANNLSKPVTTPSPYAKQSPRNSAQLNVVKPSPLPITQQTPKKKAAMPVKQNKIEKRPIQSIDLTDDEPSSKVQAMSSPNRVPTTNSNTPNNKAPTANFAANNNNGPSRSTYSPVPSPNTAPVGTVVFKTQNQSQLGLPAPPPLVRHRLPVQPLAPKPNQPPMVLNNVRMPIRSNLINVTPSIPPLPFAAKQLSNPAWRKLPPKPELKISKAENGIVISWIMDVVMNDTYEDIASYQIYAYQETSEPQKSTWKKIGDVKALPLPMACTLTQFSTGYKYFFAVRAVDVRSRVGPFSAPGSILLITTPNPARAVQ